MVRAVRTGAFSGGMLGGVGGLIAGLVAYPPTAVVAAILIGGLAAALGALAGLACSLATISGSAVRDVGTRGAGVGMLVGMAAGGVVGTLLAPFWGSFAGAVAGSVGGACIAVLNLPVLLLVRTLHGARAWSAVGCAVICGGLGVVLVEIVPLHGRTALLIGCAAAGVFGGAVAVQPIGRGRTR